MPGQVVNLFTDFIKIVSNPMCYALHDVLIPNQLVAFSQEKKNPIPVPNPDFLVHPSLFPTFTKKEKEEKRKRRKKKRKEKKRKREKEEKVRKA